MARQQYSEEVRAAVLVAIQAGDDATTVAERYGVPVGTVHSWASRQRQHAPSEDLSSLASLASPERARIGSLVMRYLEVSLQALEAQAKVFSDTEWIKKQHAGDIAILHGAIGDRAVRLLEALAVAAPEADADTPE